MNEVGLFGTFTLLHHSTQHDPEAPLVFTMHTQESDFQPELSILCTSTKNILEHDVTRTEKCNSEFGLDIPRKLTTFVVNDSSTSMMRLVAV